MPEAKAPPELGRAIQSCSATLRLSFNCATHSAELSATQAMRHFARGQLGQHVRLADLSSCGGPALIRPWVSSSAGWSAASLAAQSDHSGSFRIWFKHILYASAARPPQPKNIDLEHRSNLGRAGPATLPRALSRLAHVSCVCPALPPRVGRNVVRSPIECTVGFAWCVQDRRMRPRRGVVSEPYVPTTTASRLRGAALGVGLKCEGVGRRIVSVRGGAQDTNNNLSLAQGTFIGLRRRRCINHKAGVWRLWLT